jgi:hypothetical protein
MEFLDEWEVERRFATSILDLDALEPTMHCGPEHGFHRCMTGGPVHMLSVLGHVAIGTVQIAGVRDVQPGVECPRLYALQWIVETGWNEDAQFSQLHDDFIHTCCVES